MATTSWLKLPFTHGIEMELQLIRVNGSWINGDEMLKIMPELIKNSKEILEKKIQDKTTPSIIKKKVQKVGLKRRPEKHGGEYVTVEYKLDDGSTVEVDVIGKDPHGVGDTWILELVTPPCSAVQEMQWWLHTLLSTIYKYVAKNFKGVAVISSGMNPTQPFSLGITFGDHHHIGIKDENIRRCAYNLIRNFIPHLIGISVNSPLFKNEIPPFKINKFNILTPQAVLSNRLAFNTGQLSPVPYLTKKDFNLKKFSMLINKEMQTARMVDAYPFTTFGTIEIRVFDAQPSILSRLGIMLLIQALALKAKKLCLNGNDIPNVDQKILERMREFAYRRGLLFALTKDSNLSKISSDFSEIYQDYIAPDFKDEIKYHFQAVQNLIYYLREEFFELGIIGTPYLEAIGVAVFGGNKNVLAAPIPPAVYQLYLLHKDANIQKLIRQLEIDFESIATSVDGLYDPLTREFGNANWPNWLKPIMLSYELKILPEIVFPESNVNLQLILKNDGSYAAKNVTINAKIFDNTKSLILEDKKTISEIKSGEKVPIELNFTATEYASSYQVFYEVSTDRETVLTVNQTIPIARVLGSISYMGTEMIGVVEGSQIPISFELDSTLPKELDVDVEINLRRVRDKSDILGRLSFSSKVPPNAKVIFAPKNFDEIKSAINPVFLITLKGVSFIPMEPLKVSYMGKPRIGSSNVEVELVVKDKSTGKILVKDLTKAFTLQFRRVYRIDIKTLQKLKGKYKLDEVDELEFEILPDNLASLKKIHSTLEIVARVNKKDILLGEGVVELTQGKKIRTKIKIDFSAIPQELAGKKIAIYGKLINKTANRQILDLKLGDVIVEYFVKPSLSILIQPAKRKFGFLSRITGRVMLSLKRGDNIYGELILELNKKVVKTQKMQLRKLTSTLVPFSLPPPKKPGTYTLTAKFVAKGEIVKEVMQNITVEGISIENPIMSLGLVTKPPLGSMIKLGNDGKMYFEPKLRYLKNQELTIVAKVRINSRSTSLYDNDVEFKINKAGIYSITKFWVTFPKTKIPKFYTYTIELYIKVDSTLIPLPKEAMLGITTKDFGILIPTSE